MRKKNKSKKQINEVRLTTLEFLGTYGWAILVVAIAISTLMYFINPTNTVIDIDSYCIDYCEDIGMEFDSCKPINTDDYVVKCYKEGCVNVNLPINRSITLISGEREYVCVETRNIREKVFNFEKIKVLR